MMSYSWTRPIRTTPLLQDPQHCQYKTLFNHTSFMQILCWGARSCEVSGYLGNPEFWSTLQPHYNTVVYSTNSVITRSRLGAYSLCITLFCYNTWFLMDPKISVITRFQCFFFHDTLSTTSIIATLTSIRKIHTPIYEFYKWFDRKS